MTEIHNDTEVRGRLTVSLDQVTGGSLRVNGSATVGHDLTVGGLLRASGISCLREMVSTELSALTDGGSLPATEAEMRALVAELRGLAARIEDGSIGGGRVPTVTLDRDGYLVIDGEKQRPCLVGPPGRQGKAGRDGAAGEDGEDALSVTVTSEGGSVILNGEGERTLTATVWLGGDDVTDRIPPTDFSWRRESRDPDDDRLWDSLHSGIGNRVVVTASEIRRLATFFCDVTVPPSSVRGG